jgi:hypothetical protein
MYRIRELDYSILGHLSERRIEWNLMHSIILLRMSYGGASQVLQGIATVLSNQRLYDKSVPYASAKSAEIVSFPFS